MPNVGVNASTVATVRNTFIHLPDIPLENSDDSDDACHKQRFRTCPTLEGRTSTSPSPSPRKPDDGVASGTSATVPPVLLGRSGQSEELEPAQKAALPVDERKVVVKNSFIHTEVACPWHDWDLSPGPGFSRARPTTCPSFEYEKSWSDDEEAGTSSKPTNALRQAPFDPADIPDGMGDDDEVDTSPLSTRFAHGRYGTMELQDALVDGNWFPEDASPSSSTMHFSAELGQQFASGLGSGEGEADHARTGSLTLEEAVLKAQEAAQLMEAASNEHAQQEEQGSPHFSLFDAVMDVYPQVSAPPRLAGTSPQAEQPLMFPSTSPMAWAHMPLAPFGVPMPQAISPCGGYWPLGFPIPAATSPVASTSVSPTHGAFTMPCTAASTPAAPSVSQLPVLELAPLTAEVAVASSVSLTHGSSSAPCTAASAPAAPASSQLPVLELASLTGPPAPSSPAFAPLLSSALLRADAGKQDAGVAPSTQAGGGGRRQGGRRLRLWAHIYLHMQDVPGFDLVPRLIGRRGCNMRRIAEETGAKIRIRGRGSGHLEVDGKSEAPTPLMVAVTTDHQDGKGFLAAIVETMKALKAVEVRFRAHCDKQRWVHEGPCYSLGLVPPAAREILATVLDEIPQLDLGSRAASHA